MSCSCFSSHTNSMTLAEPNPAKHVNFNVGMVLGVDDFTQEFAYLSGRDQLLLWRNSVTGAIEVTARQGSWGSLNSALHAND